MTYPKAQKLSYSNFYESTITTGTVSSGDTSFDVAAAPTSDGSSAIAAPFYLVIDPDTASKREVVEVTNVSSTTLTVARDVEGRHSTDPTHTSGTVVRMAVVGQMFDDLEAYVDNEITTIITGQADLASGLALTDELLISDGGTLKKGDVSLIADAIDGAGIDASAGTLVNAAIGKQSIWVPATAMYPTSSNGCADITSVETTAGRPDLKVLDFDASSDENAQFSIAMPSYWNEGTITFQAYWTTAATDTDGVAWGLSGVACSDNDTIDVAFGTAVVVTDDALGAAEDLCVTAESGAVTIAGTPTAGDLTYFNIVRDVSDANDDMTEDARLIGIKIFYTVDDVHEA